MAAGTGLKRAPGPQLICVIGAECTGKSTLCQALAQQLDGLWVHEYLRTFCMAHGRTPRSDEQASVARGQLAAQAAGLEAARSAGKAFVFCDGSPLLTAIYSQHYFQDDSLMAQARDAQAQYALTLLLEPDLPWVPDANWRDGPTVQRAVHKLLQAALGPLSAVVRIGGLGEERLRRALQAIAQL